MGSERESFEKNLSRMYENKNFSDKINIWISMKGNFLFEEFTKIDRETITLSRNSQKIPKIDIFSNESLSTKILKLIVKLWRKHEAEVENFPSKRSSVHLTFDQISSRQLIDRGWRAKGRIEKRGVVRSRDDD